jgi:hypothetical protein
MAKKLLLLILGFVTIHLDAQMFKPLGLGVADPVIASAADNNFLYVATSHSLGFGKGNLVTVNKWNGFYWQQFPGITFNDSSIVKSMAVYKGQVYLGGNFIVKSPVITNSRTLVRFNTLQNKWEAVLANGTTSFSFLNNNGHISSMMVYRNQLFIGGNFYTVVNGDTTQSLIIYNGNIFMKSGSGSFPNSGVAGTVNSMFVLNDSLFIGGNFTKVGGITTGNLIALDSAFTMKAFFFTSTGISKLASYQNSLALLTMDPTQKIAVRNGTTFQVISSNLSFTGINDIEEYNNELWASGGFNSGSSSIVKYNGTWTSSNLPFVTVSDLLKFRGGLYAVSPSDFAANLRINRVAQIVFLHTRISGRVYHDANQNCKFDAGDKAFAAKQVHLTGPENHTLTTDGDGYYQAIIPLGSSTSYQISLAPFKNWEIDLLCSKSTYTFTAVNNGIFDTLDFTLKAKATGADIKINITPNNGYTSRRDFMEEYTITYSNNGTTDLTAPAGIKVMFNKKLTDFSSPQTHVFNTSDASWAIAPLKVGEQRSISFSAKAKIDSFNVYENIEFIASSALPDLDAQDNADTLVQRITSGGTTPVLKDVYPLPVVGDTVSLVSPSNNYISYIIHFENTSGVDTIHDVIVIDTIDVNSSIQYIEETGASHAYTTKLYSCPPLMGKGVIVWTFSNINLPPFENNDDVGNRGHIGFKVQFNSNLPLGTIIKNTAHIAFDYLDPLKTNDTYAKVSNQVGIGPVHNTVYGGALCVNPVNKEIVLFKEYKPSSSYSLVSASGAVVKHGEINAKTIAVSDLAAGIYFLMIEEENRFFSQKIVIN